MTGKSDRAQKYRGDEKNISENVSPLGFNSGFEVLSRDLSIPVGFSRFDSSREPRNFETPIWPFFLQIPFPSQALSFVGRPVMPSRRQIGGQGSVRRWLKAAEVPSGSQSSHFPGFGGVPETFHHPALCYTVCAQYSSSSGILQE